MQMDKENEELLNSLLPADRILPLNKNTTSAIRCLRLRIPIKITDNRTLIHLETLYTFVLAGS